MAVSVAQADAMVNAMRDMFISQGNASQGFNAGIPSSTPFPYNVHGPSGLFASPGIRTPIFSAYTLPQESIINYMPVIDSFIAEQLLQLITGIGTPNGALPVGQCDDLQTVDFIRACRQYMPFGFLGYATEVQNLVRLTLQARGESMNLPVVGGVSPAGAPLAPTFGVTPESMLDNNINTQLFVMRAQFQRTLSQWVYSGNPASGTAGGGYLPPKGLDLQIKTGYLDVDGVTACDALDSCVKTLNSADPATIFRAIVDCYHRAKVRARQSGLDPVRFALSIHPNLFYEITKWWPCTYETDTCSNTFFTTASIRTTNSGDLVRERDDLRNRSFLRIDGDEVQVIQDGSLLQSTVSPGTYESTIYLTPMTVIGGIPSLVTEVMNFNQAVALSSTMTPPGTYSTTDGGRFLVAKKAPNNLCMQMNAYVMPRFLLLTPHLAARITDVQYTPSTVYPSDLPGQPGYVNGGIQAI